jgi:molybdenum cofactor cytidylyltransferase
VSISLSQALRISSSSVAAFIGAGGKTTALFQLARELVTRTPVSVTATSHLGAWQLSQADRHSSVEAGHVIEDLKDDLQGITVFTGALDGERTRPLDDASLARLSQYCREHSVPLLIEADGSRQKPLKAWAVHEPPIPEFVDLVVEVAGLNGIGKPLTDETVHRSEIFSRLSGLNIGETVTSDALMRVLTHPEGGQKNIPSGARKTLLLNQADTPELQAAAHRMAHYLLGAFDAVVVSSLSQQRIFAVHEPVAGIILAAGESKRLGKPKQLLNYKGQSFIRAVTKTALEAGLSPVIVVMGAKAEPVEAEVADLDVRIVRNDDWQSGQGSSVRRGIETLLPPPPFGYLLQIQSKDNSLTHTPSIGFGGGWEGVGACIFLLVDQPQVEASVLRALVEKHAEGLYPVVAPLVMDRRANPVLFDRITFPDLTTLEGDVGGRAIMHKHRVEYLPWHDERLLLDVDTEEQYQRLIADDTV